MNIYIILRNTLISLLFVVFLGVGFHHYTTHEYDDTMLDGVRIAGADLGERVARPATVRETNL